jgi:putative intracellular protease/amidase
MARCIGMLIFPRLTQLDMTGPYEVLARLPNTTVELIARSAEPVTTDCGMQIVPTTTYADCPPLDVVMVPGGPGQQDLTQDEEALGFLRKQAAQAQFVTSVCTGSLLLGPAGLLKGRRATYHWNALEYLRPLGAPASISHSRLPPSWKAKRWRAKSSRRSNMIRRRRSTPARPRPPRARWSTGCGQAGRN